MGRQRQVKRARRMARKAWKGGSNEEPPRHLYPTVEEELRRLLHAAVRHREQGGK